MLKSRSIFFVIVFLSLLPSLVSAKSFRQDLIEIKEVQALYPLGPEFSYIKVDYDNLRAFYPQLAQKALEAGGRPAVLDAQVDPFTEKLVEKWVPVSMSPQGEFVNPKTNKKEQFSFGRVLSDSRYEREWPELVRFQGVVQLESRYTVFEKSVGGSMHFQKVGGLIIKHETPQAYAHKDNVLPEVGQLIPPPSPQAQDWNFDGTKQKKSFFKALTGKSDSRSEQQRRAFAGFQALCKQFGGNPRYIAEEVVYKKNAFDEFETDEYGQKIPVGTEWNEKDALGVFGSVGDQGAQQLLACEGQKPFLVKFVGGERDGVTFGEGRTLEGISFNPLAGSRETAMGGAQTIQSAPSFKAQGASDPKMEELALTVANTTKNTTMEAGSLYSGLYNGYVDGCTHVTVQKVWRPEDPKSPLDTQNYRICNGQITQAQETMFSGGDTLPKGLGQFINQVAKDAQQYGAASSLAYGYDLKGHALRDEGKCLVEVKVFKGMRLVDRQEVNGCI